MTDFDFNDVGEQRDLIPQNTICVLQLTIRPGGARDGNWRKRFAGGASEGLDCEFTVVGGEHDKRKFWECLVLAGSTDGHAKMADSNLRMLRAMVESARGIRPDDKSETASAARKISYADLDGLRFMARLGIEPPQGNFRAKNKILEIITPERPGWQKPEQITAKSVNGGMTPAPPTTPPPAGSIERPKWGQPEQGR
jgi:hypothetical protein